MGAWLGLGGVAHLSIKPTHLSLTGSSHPIYYYSSTSSRTVVPLTTPLHLWAFDGHSTTHKQSDHATENITMCRSLTGKMKVKLSHLTYLSLPTRAMPTGITTKPCTELQGDLALLTYGGHVTTRTMQACCRSLVSEQRASYSLCRNMHRRSSAQTVHYRPVNSGTLVRALATSSAFHEC